MTDSIKPSSTYRTNVRINKEDVVWPDCGILHEPLDELLRQEEERFYLYRGDPPEEWVNLCRENPRLRTENEIRGRIFGPIIIETKGPVGVKGWRGRLGKFRKENPELLLLFIIFVALFLAPADFWGDGVGRTVLGRLVLSAFAAPVVLLLGAVVFFVLIMFCGAIWGAIDWFVFWEVSRA